MVSSLTRRHGLRLACESATLRAASCHVRLSAERRMAAGKYQTQPVIPKVLSSSSSGTAAASASALAVSQIDVFGPKDHVAANTIDRFLLRRP